MACGWSWRLYWGSTHTYSLGKGIELVLANSLVHYLSSSLRSRIVFLPSRPAGLPSTNRHWGHRREGPKAQRVFPIKFFVIGNTLWA
jgi:hypothetical protein